jgi:7,8-dihydropterin-6-yl-methyl-4-(beta-D-ribofuranosyl)aminobenzene 5'-phosphate synthase
MGYDIRITVLVDNKTSRADLIAEHGLSLWIEYKEKRILFDTGQSNAVIKNAKQLGVDLARTDAIVISHGHYDHTGGLSAVLDIAAKAKIYLHPAAIEAKFIRKASGVKLIGMSDSAKKAIQGRHVIWTVTPAKLFSGMAVTGQVPRISNFEDVGGIFYLDENCQKVDELLDDQTLFIESAMGLIMVLGCAHSGAVNTIEYISKLTVRKKIHAVIGGMHLMNANRTRIANTINAFGRYDIQKIVPLHCTGQDAMEKLKNAFGNKYMSWGAGEQICF